MMLLGKDRNLSLGILVPKHDSSCFERVNSEKIAHRQGIVSREES